MKNSIMVDSRMKSKIESLIDHTKDNEKCYSVRFKDIQDTFFFGSETELYNFLGIQIRERFYDKELRKGYFDYINENEETIRYFVKSNRGTLELIEDKCLG